MPTKKTVTSVADNPPVPVELIERRIYMIRSRKVMLDSDLADLYEVPTKALNQAVKRNLGRFPDDFIFRLTSREAERLNRSRIVTGSQRHRDPRLSPYAFTELGVAMLSSVLNSERAVQMNIVIMRAFVKLREVMTTHKDLSHKIQALERKYNKHDEELQVVFHAMRQLLEPPPTPAKRRIGFRSPGDKWHSDPANCDFPFSLARTGHNPWPRFSSIDPHYGTGALEEVSQDVGKSGVEPSRS